MADLCKVSDVAARCTRALSDAEKARAAALITDASVFIEAYTNRQFETTVSTAVLRATGSRVRLPQKPVTRLLSIKLIDPLGFSFAIPLYGFDGIDTIELGAYGNIYNAPSSLMLAAEGYFTGSVEVTYQHGYNEVPPPLVSVVAAAVARVFNTGGSGAVGVQSETAGPFQVRFEQGATSGQASFTDQDMKLIDRYRTSANHSVEVR